MKVIMLAKMNPESNPESYPEFALNGKDPNRCLSYVIAYGPQICHSTPVDCGRGTNAFLMLSTPLSPVLYPCPIQKRLETLDSRRGAAGGGVKLTRKASETRLAAPGEEVASPIRPCLSFRSDNTRGGTNRDTSTHVCDLMASYDINIHSQHHPASFHSLETFSWLEYSKDFIKRRNLYSVERTFMPTQQTQNTKCLKQQSKHGFKMYCSDKVMVLMTDDVVKQQQLMYCSRIYKTVILPVLLYGCETWTLTLREEHRFRVFENKVLRKIFGAKRDEVTGEWRKLHNTELHALYSSPDIIRNIKSRRLRWAGHVARMGESRNAYRVLVGRPEGKRPLGRPRRRWEDNIKMDLREVGYDDRDWINLAQDRDRWRAYVRAAMNLRVP
ncbi:hypothetical protein ANN_18498 [Periplaneta americana]|uniref:Uncharacterized protein n=1 Tax=Periplaneta americana TaxID=6978 RepID=A0ABQ8SPE6_PERAM|nr:hypothetical protein ANN_18498 [Periplaneta americana]